MVENNVERVSEFVIEQNEQGEQEDVVINCISELLKIMTVAKKKGGITAQEGDLLITVNSDKVGIYRAIETEDEIIGGKIFEMRVCTPEEMFEEVK